MNESTVPVLVPEGKDATDLTVGELDSISREIKADVMKALVGGELRWAAMARVAHRWARRNDPKAQLMTFLDYDADDLIHALAWDKKADDAKDQESADPTTASDELSEPE